MNETTKRRLLLLLLLTVLPLTAHAQDQGQSIMFGDQARDRDHLTTLPESQKKKSRGDRCMEMSRDIEALKGKPQRRSTLMDRYRKECERP